MRPGPVIPARAPALAVFLAVAAAALPAWAAPPAKAAPAAAPGADLLALDAQLEALAKRVAPAVVVPTGPAAAAGLRPGDVVVALDGKPMENARQLDVNLYRRAPGETVTLGVRRGPESLDVKVAVVERPEDPDRFASRVTPERNLVPRLGILALELDDELRRSLGPLRGSEGVLVAARSGNATGSEDDLRPGDVVYAVNGVSVRGLAELQSAVARPPAGEPLVLHVERSSRLVYVVVETE